MTSRVVLAATAAAAALTVSLAPPALGDATGTTETLPTINFLPDVLIPMSNDVAIAGGHVEFMPYDPDHPRFPEFRPQLALISTGAVKPIDISGCDDAMPPHSPLSAVKAGPDAVWWYSGTCGLHKTRTDGTTERVADGISRYGQMTVAELRGSRSGPLPVVATIEALAPEGAKLTLTTIYPDGKTSSRSFEIETGHNLTVQSIKPAPKGRVHIVLRGQTDPKDYFDSAYTVAYEADAQRFFQSTELTGKINRNMRSDYVDSFPTGAGTRLISTKTINFAGQTYKHASCNTLGDQWKPTRCGETFRAPIGATHQNSSHTFALEQVGARVNETTLHRCSTTLSNCTTHDVKLPSSWSVMSDRMVMAAAPTADYVWIVRHNQVARVHVPAN